MVEELDLVTVVLMALWRWWRGLIERRRRRGEGLERVATRCQLTAEREVFRRADGINLVVGRRIGW
jgi:hypothetical protein